MDHPGVGRRYFVGDLDLRAERAGAAAQIVTEPAHHQKDRIDVRQRGFQIIQRHRPGVSRAPGAVVLGRGGTAAEIALLDLGVIGALASTGDHGHWPRSMVSRLSPAVEETRRNTSKVSCWPSSCRTFRARDCRRPHGRCRDRLSALPEPSTPSINGSALRTSPPRSSRNSNRWWT